MQPNEDLCVCIKCGKGGNAVNFIMETRGWDYHETMLYLAAKYSIPVKYSYSLKSIDGWLKENKDEIDYVSWGDVRELLQKLANEVINENS